MDNSQAPTTQDWEEKLLEIKQWLLCCVFTYFRPLYSITNEEQYEKHLCNQSSYYEKYVQDTNTATEKLHSVVALSVKRTGTQRKTKASP